MELIDKKRCVIVAAGKIDDLSILKRNIYYDDYVIAADAGYTRLKAADIEPELIVGDFDSSDTPENETETIVLSPIKDCTDTQYAVSQAVERGYNDILIIGGLGGRIDHSFANLAVAAEYKLKGVNVELIDDYHRIYILNNEKRTLTKRDIYVSVFAFGEPAEVSLNGFYYKAEKLSLSPYDSVGVSNEIVDETAEITALSGTVLVIESDKKIR